MGNYTEIFYHFAWATKRREPFITPQIEVALYDHLRYQCREMGVTLYAVNGMPDHVHLACNVPMSRSLSQFIGRVKGGSSHFINHHPDWQNDSQVCLYWQTGCGVLTYTQKDLMRVIAYIDSQKQHHACGTLSLKMEQFGDEDES